MGPKFLSQDQMQIFMEFVAASNRHSLAMLDNLVVADVTIHGGLYHTF
jgi:hypothetical protein